MVSSSLATKAWNVYAEEGLLSLLGKARSVVAKRVVRRWRAGYELVIGPFEREKRVELNGVVVPVRVHWLDAYVPFYNRAYPTEDDPNWEEKKAEAIRSHVGPDDNVVLIGGGLGVQAVTAAQQTSGDVAVFEQSRTTYETLQKTLEANDFGDQVTTRHGAVGRPAFSNFTQRGPGAVVVVPVEDLPPADVYEISCGAETEILRKLEAFEEKPDILLVISPHDVDENLRLLRDGGYEILEVAARTSGYPHIRASLESARDD